MGHVRMFKTPVQAKSGNVQFFQRSNLNSGAVPVNKPMTTKEAKAHAERAAKAANDKPTAKKRSRANVIKNPRPADKKRRRELAKMVSDRQRKE